MQSDVDCIKHNKIDYYYYYVSYKINDKLIYIISKIIKFIIVIWLIKK